MDNVHVVTKKKGNSTQKPLVVIINYTVAPDTEQKFSCVINILLKAAARHNCHLPQNTNARAESQQNQIYADEEDPHVEP
jgi:hypothetical protein